MNDQSIDIGTRIEKYIALRDKIKSMEDEFKKTISPYKDALETLNGMLLHHLNTINADSSSTRAGTVYRTAKKSATLSDAAAFRRFVIGGEHWDLADWKANASAVEEFINTNESPPPGVNFTTHHVVGVRRS